MEQKVRNKNEWGKNTSLLYKNVGQRTGKKRWDIGLISIAVNPIRK